MKGMWHPRSVGQNPLRRCPGDFFGSNASLALAAMLFCSGCTSVNTYSTAGPARTIELQRIVRDSNLASDIQIDALPLIDRGSGAKTAQVSMRNAGGVTRSVEARVEWFGSDGSVVSGSNQVWREYTLRPGEIQEATFTAGPAAQEYRLSVRASRSGS